MPGKNLVLFSLLKRTPLLVWRKRMSLTCLLGMQKKRKWRMKRTARKGGVKRDAKGMKRDAGGAKRDVKGARNMKSMRRDILVILTIGRNRVETRGEDMTLIEHENHGVCYAIYSVT